MLVEYRGLRYQKRRPGTSVAQRKRGREREVAGDGNGFLATFRKKGKHTSVPTLTLSLSRLALSAAAMDRLSPQGNIKHSQGRDLIARRLFTT